MFIKPRLYQQDIINKTLETEKSTLIQLPTGGGKTIISKEITIGLINNFNKKVLFIAPKIVLMDQTLETFKGLNPQKVHGSNNKFDANHHILISTLQTASRRNSLSPDVIIIDEVHFGYEKKMLNKIMKNNPDARIIGLSATPYDENGYPFKGFDVIINDYDLTYMIKNKYLVPLRSFVLVKPDLSNVDIIAGDYELNQLSEAVSKNTVIMEIVSTSKSYIEQSLKTIVFAVDINHAELLAAAFRKIGFTSEALHSKSEEDDSEVIERFKRGYIKVLVSVLKLTTGFDVPETDLAIIARPTKSQNLYKQMVGRVLRTVDFEKTGIDKKFAILLDCGNVIENLGKPLDPIIPKDELEKKVQKLKCKVCESENIKLKKSDTNNYWECQDCGHEEDIENKNQYVCSNCEKKYTYENGEFELVNHSLYLNCECGTETEISIATGEEEFREVDSGIEIQIENNDIKFLDELISLLSNEYRLIMTNNIHKSKTNIFIDNEYAFIDELFTKLNKSELYKLLENNTEIDIGKTFNISQNIPELLDCINDEHHYQENYNQFIAFILSIKDFFEMNNIDVKFFDRTININQEEMKSFSNARVKYNINYGIDDYLPFSDALAYVRNLNLENKNSWKQYLLSGKKPNNIPSNPHEFYAGKGWISTDHWIGKIKYLSFNKAKLFVHTLKLKSKDEWQAYINLKMDIKPPYNMPLNPEEFYINDGWKSWADWLYKDKKISITKASSILKISIKELLILLRKNKVDVSFNEFDLNIFKKMRTQLKDNIEIEKQEKDKIIPFEEAKTHSENLVLIKEEDCLEYKNNRSSNHKVSKDLSFEEARNYARNLKVKHKFDWYVQYMNCYPYYKSPIEVKKIYSKDWISWYDWLGLEEPKNSNDFDFEEKINSFKHYCLSFINQSSGISNKSIIRISEIFNNIDIAINNDFEAFSNSDYRNLEKSIEDYILIIDNILIEELENYISYFKK